MSKLLIQILKFAFLPACLMIAGKIIGLILAVKLYNLNVSIDNQIEGIFSIEILFDSTKSSLIANSFSNMFMLLSLTIVQIYHLVRYTLLTSTLKNPRTLVKITRLNLLKWVTDSETNFLKVLVWTIFLWTACAIIITSAMANETAQWLGPTAFIIALLTGWGLVRTFEIEADKIYPREKKDYLN